MDSLKFLKFVFIVCQAEGYRNILKLSCRPFAFTSYKDILKNKKRILELSPWFLFCMIFEEKCLRYLLTD